MASGRRNHGAIRAMRATFEDALPRTAQAGRLQRSQPAVHGLLMVERGAAAEVARFDERRAQAAAGGFVRDRQSVDAAADDEHVVSALRSSRERSRARMRCALFYSSGAVSHPDACHDRLTSATTGTSTFTISKSRRIRLVRPAFSPTSINIISRSCTICCGWSTSTATAASACSRSGCGAGHRSGPLRQGRRDRHRRRPVAVGDRPGATEFRAAGPRRRTCARPTASACRFRDDTFDLVYAHGVVQYTADDQRLVDECRRVLKPGELAVFQVYNRISWLNALSKLMKVPLEHEDAPVLGKYSAGEFRALLRDSKKCASWKSGFR